MPQPEVCEFGAAKESQCTLVKAISRITVELLCASLKIDSAPIGWLHVTDPTCGPRYKRNTLILVANKKKVLGMNGFASENPVECRRENRVDCSGRLVENAPVAL